MNNGVLDEIEDTPGYILLTFSSIFPIVYMKEKLLVIYRPIVEPH